MKFNLLFLLRILVVLFSLILIDSLIPLGSSLWWLSIAALGGVLLGGKFGRGRITTLGFILVLLVFYLLTLFGINISLLIFETIGNPLKLYGSMLHFEMGFCVFVISSLFSFFYWRNPYTYLVEVSLLIGLVVGALSAHRNLRLDMPLIVNDLSWNLGVPPLTTLTIFGCFVSLVAVGYGFLSAEFVKKSSTHERLTSPHSWLKGAVLISVFLLIIGGVYFGIERYYAAKGDGLLSNGVGQANGEGMSPLSFQSALGSTNQPSALLRLETDYKANPSSPMLYLRESALSTYNGRELVLGGPELDNDVSKTSPHTPFARETDRTKSDRIEVTQVSYLMTEHKLAFAIDYPTLIRPLKNPNPGRFKGGAYQATSLAPTFSYDTAILNGVGDPTWSEKTRATYLATPTDPRYHELAASLAKGLFTPPEKIKSVIDFLTQHTIYTLTPNHHEEPGKDPVAPFLFGDGRGYCVHIAHATVFLLRSMGIPARIGTGYLTDLSQARDGHVLLRMSDRHAWAEVYIQNIGWAPFDTQPARVESHAETEVDQKLLEELMGLIDPSEELLPPDSDPLPQNVTEEKINLTTMRNFAGGIGLFLLLAIVGSKIFLRFAYVLPGSAATRLKRSMRAQTAVFYDLGYPRNPGETRGEYKTRLQKIFTQQSFPELEAFLATTYGTTPLDQSSINFSLPPLSFWQRLRTWLGVSSIYQLWVERRW